jgi:integrase
MVTVAHETARTWRDRVAARRDIAVLLLGWATADRRSELAGVLGSDLDLVATPDGDRLLRIRLRGSKTSRTAAEEQYVARGDTDALLCPWCALQRWLILLDAHDTAAAAERRRQRTRDPDADVDEAAVADAASIAVQKLLRREAGADPHTHRCGGTWPVLRHPDLPVFRSLSRADGGLPHSPAPITGRSIARIITTRAEKAGCPPLRGHSLRAGRATWMFDTGATVEQVMAVTRHRRTETALAYDRRRQQRSGDAAHGL